MPKKLEESKRTAKSKNIYCVFAQVYHFFILLIICLTILVVEGVGMQAFSDPCTLGKYGN
jgi:hypothetical protein